MSYFGFLFLFLHISFVTGGTPSYVHQLTESVLPPLWTVPGIPYTTVKPSSGASPVCVFTSPSDVPLPYTFTDFGDDFGVVYGRFTDTDSFSRFGQLDVVANCYINTDKACVGKFYSTAEDCAQGALECLSLNATADLRAGPSSFVFLAFISQHLGNRGFLRSALALATDILMEIGFMKSELLTGLPKLTLEDEKEGLQRAVAQNFKHYLETEYFTVLDQKWDLLIEYVDTALRPGAGDYTPDQCTITGLLEVIRERKAPPPATEVFASVLDTVRDFVQMPLDENTLSEAYLTQTLAPQTYCAVLSFVVTSLWSMDRDILLLQSFSTSDAKLLEVIESVDQTVVADRLSDLETRIQSEFSSVVADPSTAPSVVFKKCVYSFFTSASALTEVSPTKCLRRLYVSAKDVEWDFSSGGTLVTQSDDIERYFFDFDEVNFSLLQTAGSTLEQQEQIYYPKVDPASPSKQTETIAQQDVREAKETSECGVGTYVDYSTTPAQCTPCPACQDSPCYCPGDGLVHMCPYVGDTDVIYTPSPEGAGSADVCTYTCKDPYLSPVGGGCLPRVGEYYDSVAGIYAVCQLPDAITEGARITYVAGGVRDAPGSCPFVSAWRVWSGELTTLPTALNVSTGDSRTWEATIALDHSRVLRALGDAESVSGDPSAAFLLASVESGSGLQYAWYLTARQDAGDTSTVWFALVLNISHLSALVESSYIVSEEWQRAAAPDGNGGDKYTLVLSLCWSTQGSVTFFVDHKRVSPITPVFLLPSTVFPTPLFIKLGGWIALYHEQSQITINGFAIPRYFDMLPGFLTAFRAYKYYKEDFMGTLVAASQMEVPGDPTAVSLQILGMLIDYFPISVSELAALSARLQRIAASTFKSLSSSCRPGTGNSGIECPDCGTAFYSLTDRTAGTSTCTCIPQRQLSPDAPICVRREVGYPAPKMLSVGSSFTVPTSFSGSTETMMAVWRIDRDDGPSSTTSLAVEATMECTVGLIHLREIPGQTLYQYYARNAVGVGPDLCTTTAVVKNPPYMDSPVVNFTFNFSVQANPLQPTQVNLPSTVVLTSSQTGVLVAVQDYTLLPGVCYSSFTTLGPTAKQFDVFEATHLQAVISVEKRTDTDSTLYRSDVGAGSVWVPIRRANASLFITVIPSSDTMYFKSSAPVEVQLLYYPTGDESDPEDDSGSQGTPGGGSSNSNGGGNGGNDSDGGQDGSDGGGSTPNRVFMGDNTLAILNHIYSPIVAGVFALASFIVLVVHCNRRYAKHTPCWPFCRSGEKEKESDEEMQELRPDSPSPAATPRPQPRE